MLTFDEYKNNYCGTLSVKQFEKWLVATDEIVTRYNLDTTIIKHRYAIYNILDYLNDCNLSKFTSESIEGYSYTVSESLNTDNAMIETILGRWLPSLFTVEWV